MTNLAPVGAGNFTTVYDYSGYGYHGKTSETDKVSTIFGPSVDFDGSSSGMLITGLNSSNPVKLMPEGGDFLVNGQSWFFLLKSRGIGVTQVLVEAGDEFQLKGWVFRINTGDTLEYKNHDSNTGRTVTGSIALNQDQWYRVGISIGAMTSATDDPEITIFVDGVEDVFSAGNQANQNFEAVGEISIGKRNMAANDFFDGIIADMVCYNKWFSEVEASYESEHLFEAYQDRRPFATDLSFAEIIEGGLLSGGTGDVNDEIILHPTGQVLLGGKTPEEPTILGQALIGGHAVESFDEVLNEGGILAGGVVTEEKNFSVKGGFVAGGIANIFVVYSPQTPREDNTGQQLASNAYNNGPFNDWQNPSFVTMGLDSAATVSLADSDSSQSSELWAGDFNLNIPPDLTILGIRVTINGKSSNAGRGEFDKIYLSKDGVTIEGVHKTSTEIGGTQNDKQFGDETDLWGSTWTPAELNSSLFTFAIEMIQGQGSGTSVISIYQMRVDVQAIGVNSKTVVNISGQGLSPQTFNETVAGGVLAGGIAQESEGQTEPVSGGLLVGGVNLETIAFDPLVVGGTLASGQAVEEISGSVSGGALVGGRATTLYDEIATGGALLGTTGEWTMHAPLGGALTGGAAIVEITPFIEGGAILGGKAATGFTQSGGVVLGGVASNINSFTVLPDGGTLSGGLAAVTSIEAFIPTGGMIAGTTAIPTATYTIADIGTGGTLLGTTASPEITPFHEGGSLVGGEANSFIFQVTKGGALVGGEGIETISVAVGFEGIVLGGEAVVQEIQVEPVAGGMLIGGFGGPIIVPFHEGGALIGGTAIPTVIYNTVSTGSALIGGRSIVGIQPPTSGGILTGGKAFVSITEIPFGGAILAGAGSQTFDEIGLGGALTSGEAESFIDYSGHGGALMGGSAQRSTVIHESTSGGTLVEGRAQRSTRINEHPAGGSLVTGNHELHYSFIGGVNFDDTVSYGGPITMGGSASIVRPTIRFIGDGPVVISGTAIASFAFSNFEYVPQSAVATVVISGTSNVILTINDQDCLTADKRCKIVDKQTLKRRIHCTVPELFAPYCGDLRRGNQCSNDLALLPAIIACRQRLLVQQEVLDIKNKTVLRNRGNVI